MVSKWLKGKRRKYQIEKVIGWYNVWTEDLPFALLTLKVI